MAKTRRVVRKVEPSAAQYVEEQLWPVLIGLVVLGGFLMGVSLAYLPLSGVAWHRTAWPSVVGIPLVIAAAMTAMTYVDNRLFRRSLQLSLVLCAILHVGLVVQMLRTHLFSSELQKDRAELAAVPPRPRKIVPEYHPTQLVPEEDRPRQDFEKPVEAESPQPTPEPERIVRQPTETEQSPAQPQPVPVPEQQQTTEPNVVSRNVPNEAAPRLAANTSRLSRQLEPSKSRQSQAVAMPAAVPQSAASPEVRPSDAQVERQQSAAATASPARAEPTAQSAVSEAQVARRSSEATPAAETAAASVSRRIVTKSVDVRDTPVATVESRVAPRGSEVAEVAASQTAARRQEATAAATQLRNEALATEASVSAVPGVNQRAQAREAAVAPSTEPVAVAGVAQRRASVSTPQMSSVVADSPAGAPTANTREPSAQPARLAISRGESGTAGGRRSPNLDTSLAGAASPAMTASSAARRAEATQRSPAGDALSPSATARIARSRAGAEIPSAAVKAEQLDSATTAGAAQVAEVTASSGAGLTRADAAARHDAVTGAKGVGEIDFGPTQIVAEAGSGRTAGGGQPEVNLSTAAGGPARAALAGPTLPDGVRSVAAADGGPAPAAQAGPTLREEAGPASTRAARMEHEGSEGVARPSVVDSGVPVTERGTVEISAIGRVARGEQGETAPLTGRTTVAVVDGGPARAALAGPTLRESNVAEIPEVGPRSAVAQAELDHVSLGAGRAAERSSRGEALVVDIVASPGPGGLGTALAPEVGINTRQGREDSLDVQLRSARFVRTNVGGLPAVSAAAVAPTDAYSSRAARVRGEERAGGSGSTSPQTEEAIERGLAFLARYQGADGGWSLQGFPEGAALVSDTAATALAVLAFQGAGYSHREFQYRDVVRAGIASLLKSQKENGDLFVPLDDESNKSVWLYSHSLAAIALCEAYGMTQDPALREPAQKAIDFIVSGQHAERGGWRYAPGVGTDTSVSGWMMMALKSGELAGLDVPAGTYRKIGRWLDTAQQSRNEPHLYRYNPLAPDTAEQRHGRSASKTMTAVGLLMRLYTGWERDNPNMMRGAAYLGEHPPANGTAREPLRDTYYWYYATQVMAHVGGETWQAWMGRLHPLLVNSQIRQGPYGGSWDPRAPIEDRWGPHAGRIYVTTMNLLSLEVQYRKLPLYAGTVSGE